jgi:hypothetical protein
MRDYAGKLATASACARTWAQRSSLRCADGTVLVLVAAAMFPMVGMLAFVIDVSHWFDYSRNLQNRADAAALAGGDAFGDICFNAPGSPWIGGQSVIGKWAQLYSGPGAGEPADNGSNSSANVPYDDSSVFAATNTGSYLNVPNLQAGLLSKYYVRLNANNYFDQGGTNFAMGDFCSSDPSKDATDHNPGTPGGMVDVKVTQYQLPNFVPIFAKIGPNIEAHARVEVQQQQGAEDVRPIAVGDASFIPCITANFLNNDGSVIQSEQLTQTSPGLWTSSVPYKGVNQAKQVTMPASNPVSVQLFLNNCSTTSPTGTHYDYFDDKGHEQQLGLVYINNWGNPSGPLTVPRIDRGGVHLVGPAAGTSCDPYFQTGSTDCIGIGADAFVDWPGGSGGTHYVRAVDCGNTSGGCSANTTNRADLTQGAGKEWNGSGMTFVHDTGPHYVDIWWAQLGGTVAGNTCLAPLDSQGNPNDPFASSNKCRGDLGPQQRAFAGTNGTNACNNPNFDTGPMQWITIGTTNNGGATSGANAYGGGDTPNLYVTTQIQGLVNAGPTDPPICLRVAEQTSHATGFINCGQGNGSSADQQALVTGCPSPVQKDVRNVPPPDGPLICSPAITPIDCVQNDPGQSAPILQGFDQLIGNPAPGNCATNFWPNGNKAPIAVHDFTLADKRAVIMVITAPTDMAVTNGTANIPIRDFAVFYVTGWSTGSGVKGCTGGPGPPGYTGANDTPPTGAGNGEIWGHWTSIVVPAGLGQSNGVQCNFNQFGNCVAVLTR